jgi:transcriptional regulator with XRE-family HTH domain
LAKKSIYSAQYQKFKTHLVEARKKAGLTQVDLAAKLDRPQSFVSKYERGERRLDIVEFLEVADALRIDPAAFIKRLR